MEEPQNLHVDISDDFADQTDQPLRQGPGRETHGKQAGSVMIVEFELEGQTFVALNGGPHHKFNEAVSFQVSCDTQDEIDRFWSKLCEGGEESRCGWLKDKYGVSCRSYHPHCQRC